MAEYLIYDVYTRKSYLDSYMYIHYYKRIVHFVMLNTTAHALFKSLKDIWSGNLIFFT